MSTHSCVILWFSDRRLPAEKIDCAQLCGVKWINICGISGIQLHITFMAMGYLFSQALKKGVDYKQAERDTRLRDYIIRHPELFPEPGDVAFSLIEERENEKYYLLCSRFSSRACKIWQYTRRVDSDTLGNYYRLIRWLRRFDCIFSNAETNSAVQCNEYYVDVLCTWF